MLHLKSLPLYWSYDLDIHKPSESIVTEQVLKYGDTDAVIALFKIVSKQKIKRIWQKTMQNDARFVRQNYFLSTFFINQITKQIAPTTKFNELKKLAAKY